MKIKALLATFIAILTLGLTSCGSRGVVGAGENLQILDLEAIREYNQSNNRPVVVTLWHGFDGTIAGHLNAFARQFEADMDEEHNIRITMNIMSQGTHVTSVPDAVLRAVSGGQNGLRTLPTLVLGMPGAALTYYEEDIILPLEGFARSTNPLVGLGEDSVCLLDENQSSSYTDIIGAFWQEGFIAPLNRAEEDRHLLSLPFGKSTEVMYYNADFIIPFIDTYLGNDTPGVTFDFRLDATAKTVIRSEIGANPAITNIFNQDSIVEGRWVNPTWTQVWFIAEYVVQNYERLRGQFGFSNALMNAQDNRPVLLDSRRNTANTIMYQWSEQSITYFNQEAVRGEIRIDTDENQAAMEWLLAHDRAQRFDFPSGFASTRFNSGATVISIGSSAGGERLYAQDFQVGVTNNPQDPRGLNNDQVTEVSVGQGPNISMLSPNSNNLTRIAGWLFMRYMTSSQITAEWAIETGYAPVRQSAGQIMDEIFEDRNLPTDQRYSVIQLIQPIALENSLRLVNDEVFLGSSFFRDRMHPFMIQFISSGNFRNEVSWIHGQLSQLDRTGVLHIHRRT